MKGSINIFASEVETLDVQGLIYALRNKNTIQQCTTYFDTIYSKKLKF
jgi:hypothetical protein